MSSSKKIRISQSVLVAMGALIQVLKVLKGKEIMLSDLEVTLGRIVKADSPMRPCDNRKMTLKGVAQTVEKTGRLSTSFRFCLDLLLVKWSEWQVEEGGRSSLTISETATDGETTLTLYLRPEMNQHTVVVNIGK